MTTLNNLKNIFLLTLITVLFGTVVSGCSEDDEVQGGSYGYVQFKLYKKASYQEPVEETPTVATSRASGEISELGEIQKIEVEMMYNGASISQTLVLNSYNADNAEFGMRSDKLELLVGQYTIMGYKLLNKVDEVVTSVAYKQDIEVRPGELTITDLMAEVAERGMVKFQLKKIISPSRAAGDTYLFSAIDLITVQVRNTFSQKVTTFEKLPVKYVVNHEEKPSEEIDDKFYNSETAYTDSLVWLQAGTYKVVSYTTYQKNGVLTPELETATNLNGATFTVEDNKTVENAEVPVKLAETDENIKDYKALKAIWDALGGENWNYIGEAYPNGSNWNFNKEIDMWGVQPGVQLGDDGRVRLLNLTGFGVKGVVPDAIGQLTELRILALGAHDEKYGGKLASTLNADMSEADKTKMRRHYADMFLNFDARENLSELLQWSINNDPKQRPIKKSMRIEPKDVQIGIITNEITAISKAVMRLTKLQNFFIANSTVTADKVCAEFVDEQGSQYRSQYEAEEVAGELSWKKLTELTDMELYNCKNFTKIPDFVMALPNLQALNLACNKGIANMGTEWARLINEGSTGGNYVTSKIQMLYLGYNNIGEFPASDVLAKMKNLHMLDCVSSGVTKVNAFGTGVTLSQIMLDYNQIEDIPANFCKFSNDVESLGFSNNKLTEIPNIFEGDSKYVMGSVNFSYNEITGVEDPEEFNGINVSNLNLSNNKLKKFPKEIFQAESPITTLNLFGNELEKIEEGDIVKNRKGGRNKNAHLITSVDLRFNKLSSLPDDFNATGMPYLTGFDVSFNRFSQVPPQPLNCSTLAAIGIRHQRDDKGVRILRQWPEGVTKCPSLTQIQIGSNDIRKVEDAMTPKLWIVEIKDNPNISIDVSAVSAYIEAGMWLLIYDKTQDIRGCDALGIER